MTRILIVSDSHGSAELLEEVKERHENDADFMIHCGDSELEETDPAIAGFRTVKGNCDFFGEFPEEEVHELAGMKIFVTHGHLYSVKSTLMNLYYRAKELQATVVCFGHSHVLGAEMIDGILFINPGSIRLPRGRKERTYAILSLEADKAVLEIHEYGHRELKELRQEFALHKGD